MGIHLTSVRECRRLTVWGWLLIIGCLLLLAYILAINSHDFLAQNNPVTADILVIEGYVPDSVLDTVANFAKKTYRLVVCAGLPLIKGELCTQFDNYADYNAAVLKAKGVDSLLILSAPCKPTATDRTFTTALAVKERLKTAGYNSGNLNIVCSGTHGRRSQLLYRKAINPEWNVGVISIADNLYDPKGWWRTSDGARGVVYEMFAYLYCALFFHQ